MGRCRFFDFMLTFNENMRSEIKMVIFYDTCTHFVVRLSDIGATGRLNQTLMTALRNSSTNARNCRYFMCRSPFHKLTFSLMMTL